MDWMKIKGVLACFAALSFWGLGLFGNNAKDYVTRNSANAQLQDDPSFMLMSAGMCTSALIYLIAWPQRPFTWITKRIAGVSWIVGSLYGIANISYYISAASGEKASILAPLSSVHILVPPAAGLMLGKPLTKKVALGFTCSIFTLIALSGLLPGSGGPAKHTGTVESPPPRGGLTGVQWAWMMVVIFGWGFAMVIQESMGRGVTKEQFPQAHLMFALGFSSVFWIFAFAWQTGIQEIADRANWIHFGAPQIIMLITALFSGLGTGMFTYALQCWPNLNLMTALSSLYIVIPAVLGMACLHEPPTYNVFLGLLFAVFGVIILGLEVNEESKDTVSVKEFDEETLETEPLLGPAGGDLNGRRHGEQRNTFYNRLRRFFGGKKKTGPDGTALVPPTPRLSMNPIPLQFSALPANERPTPSGYGATEKDASAKLSDFQLEMQKAKAGRTLMPGGSGPETGGSLNGSHGAESPSQALFPATRATNSGV